MLLDYLDDLYDVYEFVNIDEEQMLTWKTQYQDKKITTDEYIANLHFQVDSNDVYTGALYSRMSEAYQQKVITQKEYLEWLEEMYIDYKADYTFSFESLPNDYRNVLYPFVKQEEVDVNYCGHRQGEEF